MKVGSSEVGIYLDLKLARFQNCICLIEKYGQEYVENRFKGKDELKNNAKPNYKKIE